LKGLGFDLERAYGTEYARNGIAFMYTEIKNNSSD
jgi:hypothetical protein